MSVFLENLGRVHFIGVGFPVIWICIVMEMFWLFSVSVCRMFTVSFGAAVPEFARFLLMFSSGRVKF